MERWSKKQKEALAEAVASPGTTVSVDHGATTEEGKRIERTFGKTMETFHFDGRVVHHWYLSASAERGERRTLSAEGRHLEWS